MPTDQDVWGKAMDLSLTLGNVLTIASLLGGGLIGYGMMRSKITEQDRIVTALAAKVETLSERQQKTDLSQARVETSLTSLTSAMEDIRLELHSISNMLRNPNNRS